MRGFFYGHDISLLIKLYKENRGNHINRFHAANFLYIESAADTALS